MKLVYSFSGKELPGIKEVGGKALSLIRMTRAGFPVPPGFVLTTAFFKPWFDSILCGPEWEMVMRDPGEDTHYKALQDSAFRLRVDTTRKELVHKKITELKKQTGSLQFAVRSSSPEEDLEGASFAGGYETSLGVTEEIIEKALRTSFVSALDKRVFIYKKEHGFDISTPDIAVIIQTQVFSTVSGVAFSLNPINNCYDEAVINANKGLGETVVSGRVSPDQWIIDKMNLDIVEKKTGKKKTTLWACKNGGTIEKAPENSDDFSLETDQVREITKMVINIEKNFKKPVDIEWTYAGNTLFLLQVRPIPSHFSLPEEMQTKPGEERYLYQDRFLAKQGFEEPFSVMGLDAMAYTELKITYRMMGTEAVNHIKDGFIGIAMGKMYTNVSNNMKLTGKKRFVGVAKTLDTLGAEIINNLKKGEYVRKKMPASLKGILFKTLFSSFGLIKTIFRAYMKPVRFHEEYKQAIKILETCIAKEVKKEALPKEFIENIHKGLLDYIFNVTAGTIAASEYARSGLKRLFKKYDQHIRDKLVRLEQALPHNITIEMGLAMYNLANHREVKDCHSAQEFAENLISGKYTEKFMTAWNSFMETYGFRCPKELDISTTRYYENPEFFFSQLKVMTTIKDLNPQSIYDNGVREREAAFKELVEILSKQGKRKVKKFKKLYNILVAFGGYRELPKYYWIKVLDLVRRRVLKEAEILYKAGRLDKRDQVFDLKIHELDRAVRDPALDLRACAKENTRFFHKIKHIRHFPRLFDSRGKILYLQKKETKEGEIAGQPISPGRVRGKVKVLLTPDEKPVLPGEILVTRATDPGWTPLFINAGGIILEVGGLLQHGALVAREYCKPCIAGIEDVIHLFHDGQVIEMDGATGIIRIVE